MKHYISVITGIVGGGICMMVGGWSYGMQLLVILMIVDYFSGVSVAIYGKSRKTKHGGLTSEAGIAGLIRKIMMLAFVVIAHNIDLTFGVGYIRDAVVVGFCVNELLSVIENAGLMGLPLPQAITNMLDVLKSHDDMNNKK